MNSSIGFLFLAGTEGTGHHYYQALIKESPLFHLFERHQINDEIDAFTKKVLFKRREPRLWSGVCNDIGETKAVNGTKIFKAVTRTLKDIHSRAETLGIYFDSN